jgi:hypothetical protein
VNCAGHTPATAASSSDSTTVLPGYTTRSIKYYFGQFSTKLHGKWGSAANYLKISCEIKSFGGFLPMDRDTMDGLDV